MKLSLPEGGQGGRRGRVGSVLPSLHPLRGDSTCSPGRQQNPPAHRNPHQPKSVALSLADQLPQLDTRSSHPPWFLALRPPAAPIYLKGCLVKWPTKAGLPPQRGELGPGKVHVWAEDAPGPQAQPWTGTRARGTSGRLALSPSTPPSSGTDISLTTFPEPPGLGSAVATLSRALLRKIRWGAPIAPDVPSTRHCFTVSSHLPTFQGRAQTQPGQCLPGKPWPCSEPGRRGDLTRTHADTRLAHPGSAHPHTHSAVPADSNSHLFPGSSS